MAIIKCSNDSCGLEYRDGEDDFYADCDPVCPDCGGPTLYVAVADGDDDAEVDGDDGI